MPGSRLAAYDIIPNQVQSIYVCNVDICTTASVNFVNRSASPRKVQLAVTATQNQISATDFLIADLEIPPQSSITKEGIILSPTEYITVFAEESAVNAVAWGVTAGSVISVPPIQDNTGA